MAGLPTHLRFLPSLEIMKGVGNLYVATIC